MAEILIKSSICNLSCKDVEGTTWNPDPTVFGLIALLMVVFIYLVYS